MFLSSRMLRFHFNQTLRISSSSSFVIYSQEGLYLSVSRTAGTVISLPTHVLNTAHRTEMLRLLDVPSPSIGLRIIPLLSYDQFSFDGARDKLVRACVLPPTGVHGHQSQQIARPRLTNACPPSAELPIFVVCQLILSVIETFAVKPTAGSHRMRRCI